MTAEDLTEPVERAQGGDRDAVEAVLTAVTDDVHRLALRMTGGRDDALDATQEILVKGPNQYFRQNFYLEVREGYWDVVGQDVGQRHLEARSVTGRRWSSSNRASSTSREGPAGAGYVRDAAARAEPVQ